MTLRMADLIVAAVIMALGVVVGMDGVRLGYGWGADGPQAGFFPFALAVIIVAGCMVIMWRAFQSKDSPAARRPLVPAGGLKPILTVLLPAVGMVFLTHVVGLYVSAMLYLVAYIRWVGGFKWLTVLLVGILVPVVFYVLFEKVFLIPMPMGVYGAKLRF